jgi:nucleotide-binding universal stress UspA family protein
VFQKILLPVDNSTAPGASIRYAKQIASAANAELHLLHVARESEFREYRFDWPTEADLSPLTTLPRGSRLILPGNPAQTIVDYADHLGADLIMMPTRGRGILGQLLFGSTTMDVLRRTTLPVWVVKRRSVMANDTFSRRRIVCGIELGKEGQAVLNYAGRAAAAWNADLVIVHAIPGMSDAMLMLYGLDETGEIELLPDAARRKIRSMAAHIRVPFQLDVSIADPAEYLRRAAKAHRADLVIVGRGRHTNEWSIGANIGDIIARSDCPVITYRPGMSAGLTRGRMRQVTTRKPHAVAPPVEQPSGLEPVHTIL